MRTNGVLRYEVSPEITLNEYGEAVAAAPEWSDPFPCFIQTSHDTRLGAYEDGEFRQAAYQVLVEDLEASPRRLSLTREGEDLGEHRVLSVERFHKVGRTSITV